MTQFTASRSRIPGLGGVSTVMDSGRTDISTVASCDIDNPLACAVTPLDVERKVSVTYYTDPICSACWAMEPAWRTFLARFADVIEVRHVYGGLLRDWADHAVSGSGPQGPADLTHHWEQMAYATGQAVDASVWTRDPVLSSYPASIAAVAARRVAPASEAAFLRSLREQLFVEGRNIERPETWWKAADASGVDRAKLTIELNSGAAERDFLEDLATTRARGVRGFPTVELALGDNGLTFFGPQPLARLESALMTLTERPQPTRAVTVADAIANLGTGTTSEYAQFLDVTPARAERLLSQAGMRGRKLTGGTLWTVEDD